jgi:flagellar biosynthesis/type III secretory pathway M-ring protein FliF/YscJ
MNVQNRKPSVEPDIQVIVDEVIVNTVYDIFKQVMELNPVQDLFNDLADQLTKELSAQSFMEYNLELTEDQSKALSRCVSAKGHATVRTYLSKVENDKRTQSIYDIVKEKTKSIADAVLSSIGLEINRGAIINAVAVQANAKSEKVDEILLQKTKSSGDITLPTNCILISTNCVSVIKSSCERQTTEQKRNGEDKEGEAEAGEPQDENQSEASPDIDAELDISEREDDIEDDEE